VEQQNRRAVVCDAIREYCVCWAESTVQLRAPAVRCDRMDAAIAVEAAKSRGWELFVTREKTTSLQVASEWKLRGSTG
jgi:hypothetical protein